MGMNGSEEETYSIMFSSLRHPARRKILRMLSERTMTFSQMLEELAIPSSHLTYHLENLGELVLKDNNGKYKLSSFGNASVGMMKSAEEVPDAHTKRFASLPFRWKSLYVAFAIAILLLGSFSYLQYSSVAKLTSDYDTLKLEYENVRAMNDRLLHWSPSGEEASKIINNVIQIDVAKYDAKIISSTAEVRDDLGGIIQEDFSYSLTNPQSKFELTLVFRDNHFEQFQLAWLEGVPNFPPSYTDPQPSDPLQATKALIQRYSQVMNDTYIDEAVKLLESASNTEADQTLGSFKLRVEDYGATAEVKIMYTEGGTDFESKCMNIRFENGIISKFIDDFFLYRVGSSQVNVTKDQAVVAAKDAVKTFSYNISGTQVSNLQVLESPTVAVLASHTKEVNSLTLYPYWFVTLYLDKTYPGGITQISMGIWADTCTVENIQPK